MVIYGIITKDLVPVYLAIILAATIKYLIKK